MPGVHPAIRILSYLVFAAVVIYGGWPVLVLGGALLLIAFTTLSAARFGVALKMATRLRWLLLSIVLVYLLFTPGDPLFGVAEGWMPSAAGVSLGLHRVLCLIALVFGVSLLLQTTEREWLVAGLLWLLAPLRRLGLNISTLALRMVLTMEAVTEVQAAYTQTLTPPLHLRQRIIQLATHLVDLFEQITDRAEREPVREIAVPLLGAPRWYQWLFPLVLLGGLYLP